MDWRLMTLIPLQPYAAMYTYHLTCIHGMHGRIIIISFASPKGQRPTAFDPMQTD